METVRKSAGLIGWFKTELLSLEQHALACARVSAVMEKDYLFSGNEGDSEKISGGARERGRALNINFTRGLVENMRRRRENETIELIPEGRIKEFLLLMEMGLQRENISEDNKLLAPLSISRACPRLFWTMVNTFIEDRNEKPNNMEDVLRHISPERDW